MATSTSSRPLMEMNAATAHDPEADADTEGSGSSDNENSLLEGEQPTSADKQPLSMKRRIALVGALLLCVFTIFAFAFLLPCHKPKCQKDPGCPGKGDQAFVNWTDRLGGITPVKISLVDVTGHGRGDILVEFKIEEEESMNSSFLSQLCKSTNCRGTGLMAIHGSCGYNLWDVSRNSSLGFLACERVTDRSGMNSNGHCLLVEEKKNLVLFNLENGTTKWQTPSNSKVDSFKFVSDIDGDGERDIVFVQELPKVYKKVFSEGSINLVSGATGKILGSSLPLPGSHGGSNVLAIHAPSNKQQFVIVGSTAHKQGNSTSLWAISVSDLLQKVRQPAKEIPGQPWGEHTPDPLTGFISILKDTLVLLEPLLTDLDGDGVKDVVFVIKKESLSLVAMNGKDLAVIWSMVVPLDASIHKLFPTQHSVKENSTDVGVFVSYKNHSSGILVIDGHTGRLSWLFHSITGIPVAPVSVPGDLSTQQAFVMWLPKLEALTLIVKSRKSRQTQQQGSDGNSAEKLISRQRRHQEEHKIFSESDISSLHQLYRQEFDDVNNDDDFDEHLNSDRSDDDDDDDDDDDIASKEFQVAFLSEILKKYSDEPSFASQNLFNTYEEHKADNEEHHKADNKWLSARKVGIPLHKRGYNEDLIPNSSDDNSVITGLDIQSTDLQEELGDLLNHEKDESNHNAEDSQAPMSQDYPVHPSNLKVLKEYPPEPTRRADEVTDVQVISKSNIHNQQFPLEDGLRANLKDVPKLVEAKKPSYHKRSVQSSQSRSKCVQSSSDSADSFMAVLLIKDSNGRQLITKITEEGPLYLDPDEYENLFSIKKGDTKPKSCLRLVPILTSEPVLRDSDEGLDLVYTVSFVSENQSVHVGKIRKMSMADAFGSLEGKIVTPNIGSHKSKRENDYSFSFPRVLK